VPAGSDQVKVAANAGGGGVDIAEIVSAVDDQKVSIAGGEVQDLLVAGNTIRVENLTLA